MIFEDCIAPGTGKKSDVLMYEIAPHSKEFASFRRQAWSNLSPGGCGTFHWEATKAYFNTCKTKCRVDLSAQSFSNEERIYTHYHVQAVIIIFLDGDLN